MPILRHTGILVKDIDKSIRFYRQWGFKVFYRGVETWGEKTLEVCKMEAKDKSGVIEFIKGDWKPHIAITADGLIWENITERPDAYVSYKTDPDGNHIEFVEVKK